LLENADRLWLIGTGLAWIDAAAIEMIAKPDSGARS